MCVAGHRRPLQEVEEDGIWGIEDRKYAYGSTCDIRCPHGAPDPMATARGSSHDARKSCPGSTAVVISHGVDHHHLPEVPGRVVSESLFPADHMGVVQLSGCVGRRQYCPILWK